MYQETEKSKIPGQLNFQTKDSKTQKKINLKRTVKLGLKLDYLLNQYNSARKFKQFLEELNTLTKDFIRDDNQNGSPHKNSENLSIKKKNSFAIKYVSPNSNLNEQASLNQNKKPERTLDQIKSKSKDIHNEQQQNHQQKSKDTKQLQKLQDIKQLLQTKNNQLSNHIDIIKNRLSSSSIWEDKHFYDYTELNYQTKIQQTERRYQTSEQNLQYKEKQKKLSAKRGCQDIAPNTTIVKYTFFDQGSEEFQIMEKNIMLKRKLASELKIINELHGKFELLIQQEGNTTPQTNANSKNPLSNSQETHPILSSAKNLHDQLNSLIKDQYQEEIQNDIRLQYLSSTNNLKFLHQSIKALNKQILKRQFEKTKNQILQLKNQTQSLQNAIKEQQGYKALIILRNKQQYSVDDNKTRQKNIKQQSNSEQTLKLILEHQFLQKFLSLRISTKFSGLYKKKNLTSRSTSALNKKINYFGNVLKVKRNHSLKNILCQLIKIEDLKQNKMKSPKKKGGRLQIVSSSEFPIQKQPVSSAETNP